MEPPPKKPKKPNAIEKALDILEVFIPDNRELGTAQISEKLGLHRATASRTLLLLTQKGFLQQNPETKKFSLGRMALLLGKSVVNSLKSGIVTIAKPFIDNLRAELNETVALEQLVENSTMLVYISEGQRRHRMAGGLGDRIPINAAAGAKAILAYSDPEFVRNLLGAHPTFESLTPYTITDQETFIRQLRTVRLNGYAFDEQEIDIGINAFGVPIFNHDNLPVAALAVIGPAHRVSLSKADNILPPLKNAAQQISTLLMQP